VLLIESLGRTEYREQRSACGTLMSPRFARRYDSEEATPAGIDTRVEPLFTVDDHDERRILSWSPDPFDDDAPAAVVEVAVPPETKQPHPGPVARHAAAQSPSPPGVPQSVGARRKARRVSSPTHVHRQAGRTEEPGPPVPAAAAGPPAEAHTAEPPARKRGRPRGKVARRQVHFHVDPDEERLLLAAGRAFGSQQKGLIAALESLQEAELLRDEIDRLRELCERQRRLLAEAESLFKR
jgi:hypothetical protein